MATRIEQLKPSDPQSKGIVERANGYLETSFLFRRVFSCPDDFNAQLAGGYHGNQGTVRTQETLLEAGENVLVAQVKMSPQTSTQAFYKRQHNSTCHAAHADQRS